MIIEKEIIIIIITLNKINEKFQFNLLFDSLSLTCCRHASSFKLYVQCT